MKILPDGRVEITNKQTGEVKQVNSTELGAYNPFLVARYDDEMKRRKEATAAIPANPNKYLPIGTTSTNGLLDTDNKTAETGDASSFFQFDDTALQGDSKKLSDPNLFGAPNTFTLPGTSVAIPNVPVNPKANIPQPQVVNSPYGNVPIDFSSMFRRNIDPNKLKIGGY